MAQHCVHSPLDKGNENTKVYSILYTLDNTIHSGHFMLSRVHDNESEQRIELGLTTKISECAKFIW